jgi:hypothetical protein
VQVPIPDCVFHLTYASKWHLTMLSPFMVAVSVVIYSCLMGCMRLIWNRLRARSRKMSDRLIARLPKLSEDDDGDEDEQRSTDGWSQPEPEPEALHQTSHIDGVSRPASPSLQGNGPTHDGNYPIGVGASRPSSPIARTGRSPEVQRNLQPDQSQSSLSLQERLQGGGSETDAVTFGEVISAPRMWINVQKSVLAYLMIGYVFLAGTALEPLACEQNVDGKSYMRTEPTIQCTMCHLNETLEPMLDKHHHVRYRTLRTESIVWASLYGLGSPLLFFIVLYSHREVLKKNEFQNGFGFLSTKMREEFYFW